MPACLPAACRRRNRPFSALPRAHRLRLAVVSTGRSDSSLVRSVPLCVCGSPRKAARNKSKKKDARRGFGSFSLAGCTTARLCAPATTTPAWDSAAWRTVDGDEATAEGRVAGPSRPLGQRRRRRLARHFGVKGPSPDMHRSRARCRRRRILLLLPLWSRGGPLLQRWTELPRPGPPVRHITSVTAPWRS